MMGQLSVERRMTPSNQFPAAGGEFLRERRATSGSLVVDRRGIVVSCSDAGVRLFGGDYADLEGVALGSLIDLFDLFDSIHSIASNDSLLDANISRIVWLCRDAEWRPFQAIDVYGRRFPVEARISKMQVEGDDMYLVNLRRPALNVLAVF